MMHFPMRAWRSVSQREGGASGTGFEDEDEKGRPGVVGVWLRDRERRARRGRRAMVREPGSAIRERKEATRARKSNQIWKTSMP